MAQEATGQTQAQEEKAKEEKAKALDEEMEKSGQYKKCPGYGEMIKCGRWYKKSTTFLRLKTWNGKSASAAAVCERCHPEAQRVYTDDEVMGYVDGTTEYLKVIEELAKQRAAAIMAGTEEDDPAEGSKEWAQLEMWDKAKFWERVEVFKITIARIENRWTTQFNVRKAH